MPSRWSPYPHLFADPVFHGTFLDRLEEQVVDLPIGADRIAFQLFMARRTEVEHDLAGEWFDDAGSSVVERGP